MPRGKVGKGNAPKFRRNLTIKELSLGPSQQKFLHCIAEHEGESRPDICRRLKKDHLAGSSRTRIDLLTMKGLVETRKVEKIVSHVMTVDGLYLTKCGREVIKKVGKDLDPTP